MGKNREKIKQKYILRLIHYIAQKIQQLLLIIFGTKRTKNTAVPSNHTQVGLQRLLMVHTGLLFNYLIALSHSFVKESRESKCEREKSRNAILSESNFYFSVKVEQKQNKFIPFLRVEVVIFSLRFSLLSKKKNKLRRIVEKMGRKQANFFSLVVRYTY